MMVDHVILNKYRTGVLDNFVCMLSSAPIKSEYKRKSRLKETSKHGNFMREIQLFICNAKVYYRSIPPSALVK